MRVPRSRLEASPRRLAVIATFLVVFGATAVAFAGAVTGHLAAMHASGSDVTIVDYEVTDDDRLELTLRVHNPTLRDVDIGRAQLNAYVDGEQVTDGTTTRFEATVPSEETTNVTVRLGLREGGAERLRNADAGAISVEGQLRGFVVEEQVYLPLDGWEGDR